MILFPCCEIFVSKYPVAALSFVAFCQQPVICVSVHPLEVLPGITTTFVTINRFTLLDLFVALGN